MAPDVLVEDEEPAAHAHDFPQIVLDQHRRNAFGIDGENDIRLPRSFALIQAGQGLIQNNEDLVDRQRTCDFEPFELTQRQFHNLFAFLAREPDVFENLSRACLLRPTPITRQGDEWIGGEAMAGSERHVFQYGHGAERAHDPFHVDDRFDAIGMTLRPGKTECRAPVVHDQDHVVVDSERLEPDIQIVLMIDQSIAATGAAPISRPAAR